MVRIGEISFFRVQQLPLSIVRQPHKIAQRVMRGSSGHWTCKAGTWGWRLFWCAIKDFGVEYQGFCGKQKKIISLLPLSFDYHIHAFEINWRGTIERKVFVRPVSARFFSRIITYYQSWALEIATSQKHLESCRCAADANIQHLANASVTLRNAQGNFDWPMISGPGILYIMRRW